MKYPTLTELGTSREMIDVFGGYNHNLRIGEGEFYDMKNLTSADYPVLSPRPHRGVYVPGNEAGTPEHPLAMLAKDALCYIDANADGKTATFYINGKPIEFEGNNVISAESDMLPKRLVSMGSYVIIMPDKLYINTKDYGDKGKIEADFVANTGVAHFYLSNLDGEHYSIPGEIVSPTPPENPTNGQLWMDTSDEPHTLRQYSSTNKQWVSIATTYIKIYFPNTTTDLTKVFSEGDGVTISGITLGLGDGVIKEQLESLNTTTVIWKVTKDSIIVIGTSDGHAMMVLTPDSPITITRRMPEMDFVIESENRLWGCRYGTAINGEVVNEIYASKLGDFKNWNAFAGISTDSYVASVGTDGQFTGAITHLGHPLFFKENCVHKVYGNYPANYQIQTTACRGVQKGCSKSLAIVNETLYYKSRSAVCAYDGSLPVEISSALGEISYSNATAGALGNKYYISMQDANEIYNLFVYDAMKGMWHREDNTQALEFCNCDGELYYIDYADKQIKTVRGTGIKDTTPIKWEAITGLIGTDSPDKKYISRLVVRLSLEVGTRIYIFAEYDSSGEWEMLFSMAGTKLRSFSIPIKPKRCDHLRLRIQGEGSAKIFSICKTIEQGSDV